MLVSSRLTAFPRGCRIHLPYALQFETSAMLVADRTRHKKWMIAYQSRSGSPNEEWLEPDVCDVIGNLADRGFTDIVIQPIGFVCDHIEVLFRYRC